MSPPSPGPGSPALPLVPALASLLFAASTVAATPVVVEVLPDAGPGPSGPAVVRSRLVRLDVDALGWAPELTATLFPDLEVELRLDRRESRAPGRLTWLGTVEGEPAGTAILVVADDRVTGNVRVGGRLLQLRPADGGRGAHRVVEIDPGAFPPCATGAADLLAGDGLHAAASTSALDDDGSVIDVLVAYTADAAGEVADIESAIQLAVDEANAALERSLAQPRFRLVAAEEVDYVESGDSGLDLARLLTRTDGFMDEVHAWRDRCGADLVGLWVRSLEACGRAALMRPIRPGFASAAFGVCTVDCATGNLTFAHELAHNLGCAHDRPNAPGGGAFPFSHGHAVPGVLRTILAYDCSPSCPRQPYYSNPLVSHGGVPTGVPIGDPGEADNAATVDEAAYTAANFRPSRDGCCDPDGFEARDTCEDAWPIEGGEEQVRNHCDDQEDWLRFVGCLGETYVVEVSAQEPRSEIAVEIVDRDCATVLAADDGDGTGIGARVEWVAPDYAPFLVRLRGRTGLGSERGYRVSVGGETVPEVQDCCDPDPFEPEDACETAPLIEGGGSQDRNFCDDKGDWLRFVACADELYVVALTNQEIHSQAVIEVVASDCTSVLAADDGGGTGRDPFLEWTAPTSGPYRIRVLSLQERGPGHGYRVTLSGATVPAPEACCTADGHEPLDSCAEAPLLAGGEARSGNHCDDDVDWLRLPACAGRPYVLEVADQGASGRVALEVLSPDCSEVLASDDAGGTGLGAHLDWTAPESAAFPVRISSLSGQGERREYRVYLTGDTEPVPASCCEADPFEASDDCASPSVAGGGDAEDRNHCDDDVDWLSFLACRGREYEVTVEGQGPLSRVELALLPADCTAVLASDDAAGTGVGSRLTWTAGASGHHLIRVTSLSGPGAGRGYRVTLAGDTFPCEPSAAGSSEPLRLTRDPGGEVRALVENVAGETAYGITDGRVGRWYAPSRRTCAVDWDDTGSTTWLAPDLGPGDRWLVISAVNEWGESSSGRDSRDNPRERSPDWPPGPPCP